MDWKEKIGLMCEALNISLADLADGIQVPVYIMRSIETGKKSPSRSMLESFETVFDVNPIWLRTSQGEVLSSKKFVRSTPNEIYQRVKQLIGNQNLAEFSKRTGIALRTLEMLNPEQMNMTDRMVQILAETCDVSKEWILCGYEASKRFPFDREMQRYLLDHEDARCMLRYMMERDTYNTSWEAPKGPPMDPVLERTKQIINDMGLRIVQLVRATKTDSIFINEYLSGSRPISSDWLDTFCQAYGIRREWIDTGEGEKTLVQDDKEKEIRRLGSGQRLKRIRETHHLDQKEMAEIAGVTPGMISLLETGRAKVSEKVAKAVAERFGLNPDDIIYGSGTVEEPANTTGRLQSGIRLKQIRKELRLDQKDIAEITGVTRGMISLMETGRSNVTSKVAWALEKHYGISERWLMYGEGEKHE